MQFHEGKEKPKNLKLSVDELTYFSLCPLVKHGSFGFDSVNALKSKGCRFNKR